MDTGHTAVRLLPTDPRDMVPPAVSWVRKLEDAIAGLPHTVLSERPRESVMRVAWVLAAASDFENSIPGDHTAAMLAAEAGVGDRVWQKRTAWLRAQGWLRHGPRGPHDGWILGTPA